MRWALMRSVGKNPRTGVAVRPREIMSVWQKVGGEWKTAAYIWNRGEEK
jgi:hypothetical protein